MTDLIFIRHGETDWNRQQRSHGQIDVDLNATGCAQAERLAARPATERADVLISSDLGRAQQTAAPLARAWAMPVLTLPGLCEQGFGILEGLEVPTIQAQHAALWQQWLAHRADVCLPGGKSLREFLESVLLVVRDIARTHAGRRVAVVAHGGVLDMLWRTAGGLSLDGFRECTIPNAGINRLRWQDGGLHVEQWGDDPHLADLPEQPSPRASERREAGRDHGR